MRLGFIGLGKMGLNMVKRLIMYKHDVYCTSRTSAKKNEVIEIGANWVDSIENFKIELKPPRFVWLMVPAGSATEEIIVKLSEILEPNDVIIDGGNSNWKDSVNRAKYLKQKGLNFVDVGTSGGIWGLQNGYCLMVGGETEVVSKLEQIFDALAGRKEGWAHVGKNGAGHFVKMVHNAIEYGIMQSYAEGFDILYKSEFDLDLAQISKLWNHGSVIRSWLLELCESIFKENKDLSNIEGYVDDSGEGRWAVQTAIEREVAVPVIAFSLFARFMSRDKNSFSNRLLAALRNKFGGHTIKFTK